MKKICFAVIILVAFTFIYKCLGNSTELLDLTRSYPEEQKNSNYLLYINEKPLKVPYIAVKDQLDDTVVYYFPGKLLINALGVEWNYNNEKNVLIIKKKEFPKSRMAIGIDIKTGEKIVYLPFKEVLSFLKLPVRVQESATGISCHTRTDGFIPSFQQLTPTPTPEGNNRNYAQPARTNTPYVTATPQTGGKSGQQEIRDKLDNVVKPNTIPNSNSLPTPVR
ncbi:MAG: hypothetical protein ABRQ37_02405 [Candidatus Eremiobacterota bacterium]